MGKGIGGFISGIFGSENEDKAAKPAIDSNAYNYGGYEGGATDAAMRYRENAANAQTRGAAQADYTQANESTKLGLQARGNMNTVGQAQLARALGQTPSIAQMQADRQMQQAGAAQAAAKASARGPGGLALAQQNAANNMANAHGAISGQAQVNAAQERAQAEAAAAGTFGNMQQLDLGRSGLATNQSQYQATNQMQQRELNDRMTSDQLKNEIAVQGMQLGAKQNEQAQNSANSLGAAGINAGVGGQNASMNQSNAYGITGMASNFLGGYAGGGGGGSVTGKADGGPVDGGTPYLVGERGPELIVPKKDAVVIPAERTAPMLSRVLGSDKSTMRDGPSDRRTYNMEKSFHRDTPQDQARVKRQVQDQASREADAMMAGYAAALAQGPSVAVREQETPDLRLAARADGGPLDQGQTALVGERGPELVVPQLSTWGTGGTSDDAALAYAQRGKQAEQVQAASQQAQDYVDPYQRDIDRVRNLRAVSPDLVDDEDRRAERVGHVRMRTKPNGAMAKDQPDAEAEAKNKADVSEGKALPKRGKLAGVLGTVHDGAMKLAGGIDTAYHGPTAVAGPNLIPVSGARAMGGPMSAGQAYQVGENGAELVMPMRSMGGASPMAAPSFDKLSPGGGMDVLGSLKAHSDFATQYQRDPTGGMVAREDGGPVSAGQTALVGEKGPEMVVPSRLSSVLGNIRGALSSEPETAPAPREPRHAEITSGAPLTTKTDDPGTSRTVLQVSSHGYAPEKAQRMADDQEPTRYTRAQRDDIAEAQKPPRMPEPQKPGIVPLSAFLSRVFGGR